MEVEILETAGFYPAIRAMRLPMKSGSQSDSRFCEIADCDSCEHEYEKEGKVLCDLSTSEPYVIGQKDRSLSLKLIKAGASHGKHARQIDAWLYVRAPRYWWSEADTYTVGTAKVSESTMHRILKDKITEDDFEEGTPKEVIEAFVKFVEDVKNEDMKEKDKIRKIKQALPEGYLQARIMKFSYQALRKIYSERKNHRLPEWHVFCRKIEELPYSDFITEDA